MSAQQKRVGVVVIDDHPFVAKGMAMWIRSEAAFEMRGTARSCKDGLALMREVQPDIAIVDLCLGSDDGIEMTAPIRSLSEALGKQISVLHMSGVIAKPAFMLRSMRSGGNGYYRKAEAPELLTQAVHALSQRRKWYIEDSEFREMMSMRRRIESTTAPDHLTPREYEVFWFYVIFVKDHANKKSGAHGYIADKLDLSVKQVEKHMETIRHKLHVHDGHELNRLILDAGYVDELPPLPAARELTE